MNDNVILPDSPQSTVYGPITPSQMFERTAALLRENFKLFFGIAAVVIGVEIVVGGVLGGSGILMRRSAVDTAPMMKAVVMAPLMLLGGLLTYIFAEIVKGALFLATQAKLAGAPTSAGEACKLAAEKVWRLVGISILVALRILGYILLIEFAAGVLLFFVALAFGGFSHAAGQIPFHFGRGTASLGLGIFAVLCLLMLLVIYLCVLLWLVIRYAVAIPAALAENLSVTEAIRRSIHLSRGSKGRLFALFLALAGIVILLLAITLPLQLMAVHGASHSTHGMAVGLNLVAAAIRILISWGIIAFASVATALCYYDLRVRKEGFGAVMIAPTLELPSEPRPFAPDGPIEDLPIS